MLHQYSTNIPTYTNGVTDENQLLYLTEQSSLSSGPSSHVPPFLSSLLYSNQYNFGLFDQDLNLSLTLNDKYTTELPQTLSANELLAITCQSPTPPLTNRNNKGNKEQEGEKQQEESTSLVDLGRRLRTNLSLAKQRMMTDLKRSTEPSDIAMYTRLENIILDDSKRSTTSFTPTRIITSAIISQTVGNGRNLFTTTHSNNKNRVHKRKPYHSSSSYMELQTNPNGYVSVVLKKKSSSCAKNSYATLTRSFSFNIRDSDDSDNDSDFDFDFDFDDYDYGKDERMDKVTDPLVSDSRSMNIDQQQQQQQQQQQHGSDNTLLSPTWMQDLDFIWEQQQQQQQQSFCHIEETGVLNETQIDSWLQRGGLSCSPIVAATDQELADLLDFD